MKKQLGWLRRGATQRSGQALVEYALILSLISVVAVTTLRGLGQSINTKLGSINSNLE